ncbi:MAG TPA: LpqB family beta-propeller domain-containing protein [Pyrinomonadaceae bacterium]|nr:LpqB family beta-propeller domain-containing protein [Pyrinomonadaceae bacterium]
MSNPNTLASRTRRSLTALAAAAVLLLIAAFDTRAQTPAATKIAFDRNAKIWTMNPDGSNQTEISGNIFGINPALSPDGKRVAFVCGIEPWDICVMNADGTGFSVLTETQNNSNPTWSPDSTKIAFTSTREGTYHIYTMNADGTNVQRLVVNDPDLLSEDHAAWSPDGTRIAFVGITENAFAIYTTGVQGGAVVEMLSNDQFKENLAWSPDGTRIAFDTINDVYVVGADGNGLLLLSPAGANENSAPTWSPDSSQVVFYREKDIVDEFGSVVGRETGLYVTPSTGGALVSLNAPGSRNPSWSVVAAQDPEPKPEPTPAERINDLISRVKKLQLHHGITNSLVVKLQHALKALNAGDTQGACASLKAFANEVNAQSGKKLPAVQATQLTDEVNAIRAALGCS